MKAKNGRNMIKCTCAECGITMVKFVKQETKCALTSWGQYIQPRNLGYELAKLTEQAEK